MDNGIKNFYEKICHLRNPSELFECLKVAVPREQMLINLKSEWRNFIMKYHPDKFATSDPLTIHLVEQVSGIINSMYSSAVDVINNGPKPAMKVESQTIISSIKTKKNVYDIYENLVDGEFATIYRGLCGADKVWRSDVRGNKEGYK